MLSLFRHNPTVLSSVHRSRFCTLALVTPVTQLTAQFGGSTCVENGILILNSVNGQDVKQRSDEWHELRNDRLTASAFSTALGFWGLSRRVELWEEKIGLREPFAGNQATEWGSTQEAGAIEAYQKMTGNIVQSLGFKIYHEGDNVQDWLGASPDGLVDAKMSGTYEKGGVLEVKCPHNKGRPDLCVPWTLVPYYYMPQLQGLMEILDRDWLDFYVWTLNGSKVFRVERNADYWTLMFGVLSDFWWANVVPAKQSLLLQKNVDVKIYRPCVLPKMAAVIKAESQLLSAKAPLIHKGPCLESCQ
ncbi:hypothetical protein KP509_15G061300 [Ceratopteris richardii]|uniref:YqaJ viral recombinase domain-containing protein n=1 Tax=Ceratopteris richardii TaxID=49495 RepID=A0A8T2T8V8_CERRI|nr:hypothetical protein KP509_15G061300 [Ceratopteris richardii]